MAFAVAHVYTARASWSQTPEPQERGMNTEVAWQAQIVDHVSFESESAMPRLFNTSIDDASLHRFLTTLASLQHLSTAHLVNASFPDVMDNTSLQHISATRLFKSLQRVFSAPLPHFFTTRLHNISLRRIFSTLLHNTFFKQLLWNSSFMPFHILHPSSSKTTTCVIFSAMVDPTDSILLGPMFELPWC